ncbi:restriction endonuclease subunit S [Cryobacterium sp. M15]|uniref:restriction endonuclease subunit S n=1 Tax=Cryobacterium sp. M15 TaxID=2048291 RepID=UPI001304D892|nr:restriction endonuclease subunit S [Cryobacterium sp. M15]
MKVESITSEGRIENRKLARISEQTHRSQDRSILQPDDLLFSIAGTIGRVARVDETLLPANTNQALAIIRPDQAQIDVRYLLYCLRDRSRIDHALSLVVQSVQANLSLAELSSIEIPLPPLDVQRAIAEVLGALDDKISANVLIKKVTDEYLAAELDVLILGRSMDVPLSTLANINALTRKPVSGAKIHYVDIAAVGVGTHSVPEPIEWNDAPGRARRVLRRGDTLWSTVRPNRRSHSLNLSTDPNLVGSTGLAVLTPTNVGFAYLYEVTKRAEFTSYLETVAEGSAYPAVRADRFGEAQVPLVPETQRDAFEAVAAPMREHLHSLSQENFQLAATRNTLLPQLLSGKLRVKDAEKSLAGVF